MHFSEGTPVERESFVDYRMRRDLCVQAKGSLSMCAYTSIREWAFPLNHLQKMQQSELNPASQ